MSGTRQAAGDAGDPRAGGVDDGDGLMRLLVESVRDYAIFALDPTGVVVTWNQGARRLKGYEASDIIGRHFRTFYPEADKAAGKPEWELVEAARDGRFEDEGWRVRKDGTLFWANVVITALRDERGTLVGFAKVTRDLTERKANEERAVADARRVAEAEGANRAKSQFLAAMSHELRTPLNAIGGYAELLGLGLGGSVTEQQREYLERIRLSQRHLLGIITDLLNYSRIEAGQLKYDIADAAACELLDAVAKLVEPQAALKGVAFHAAPCDPALRACADRLKAEQVLLNLLSNAVKFTPAGGTVTLGTRVLGGVVAFVVQDNGPGIPADRREAVFEPFVQLGRHTSSPGEGTGLGLAISREMARAMGGDVTVEEAPGGGARFTFTLPQADAPR